MFFYAFKERNLYVDKPDTDIMFLFELFKFFLVNKEFWFDRGGSNEECLYFYLVRVD